jgi:hypothetical protein
MRVFLSILSAAALCLAAASIPATMAEDDTKTPGMTEPASPPPLEEPPKSDVPKPDAEADAEPEPDTRAQRSGQLWVCCDDGRERWTATPEVCRQRKGQLLPSRFCERPKYVCCKQGRAEWWMPDANSCYADGGIVADKSYCR